MKKPSIKQIRAFHYINQGMSKRQAMIKAGYSVHTANQAVRVMKTHGMRSLSENLATELVDAGLSVSFIANKIAGWLEAKKPDGQSDYQAQLAAAAIWFKIMQATVKVTEPKPKRTLTIQEWVNSDLECNPN